MPSRSTPQEPISEPRPSSEPSQSSTIAPSLSPDLEAGQQRQQSRGTTDVPVILHNDPATFQDETGLPRAIAELSTYTNKRINRRFSRCWQAVILHQQGKVHRLEKRIEVHHELRKIDQVHGDDSPLGDLLDRLAKEMLFYNKLLQAEKEIRSLPHPTRLQYQAVMNTFAEIDGLDKESYEFLGVADDCLILERNPALAFADYFLYKTPNIFRWLGLTLPTPEGRPRDVNGGSLRKALTVLAVFVGVSAMAIPACMILLVHMDLGQLIAAMLVVTLIYSIAIVLMTAPESLTHRMMGVAAMMAVLLAMATLRAEVETVGPR